MIVFSTDLETTGLKPEDGNKILEIGIVYADDNDGLDRSKRKYFHCYVYPGDDFNGNIFAINLNKDIITKLALYHQDKVKNKMVDNGRGGLSPVLEYHEVTQAVEYFVRVECGHKGALNYLGKNWGMFDKEFLQLVPNFKQKLHWAQRVGDVGNLYKNHKDVRLPNLTECMERCRIPEYNKNAKVPHTSVEDAEITLDLWIERLAVIEKAEQDAESYQNIRDKFYHRGYGFVQMNQVISALPDYYDGIFADIQMFLKEKKVLVSKELVKVQPMELRDMVEVLKGAGYTVKDKNDVIEENPQRPLGLFPYYMELVCTGTPADGAGPWPEIPLYLHKIPHWCKDIYESLTKEQKKMIHDQAVLRAFTEGDDITINHFWNTLDFNAIKST